MPRPKKDALTFFVTNYPSGGERQTVCYDCLTKVERKAIRITDTDDYQVWEDYSSGWEAAPVCDRCRLSLPVFLEPPPGPAETVLDSYIDLVGWDMHTERELMLNFIDKMGAQRPFDTYLAEVAQSDLDADKNDPKHDE